MALATLNQTGMWSRCSLISQSLLHVAFCVVNCRLQRLYVNRAMFAMALSFVDSSAQVQGKKWQKLAVIFRQVVVVPTYITNLICFKSTVVPYCTIM